MTQLEVALKGKNTGKMKYVARKEGIPVEELKVLISKGFAVILANKNHSGLKPVGIGKNLRVKVNTNIGASPLKSNLKEELKKLKVSLDAGTDTLMDLTVTKNADEIDKIRMAIIKNSPIPVGTVPVYQAVVEAGSPESLDIDTYLKVFKKHAKSGVDFTTVHAGVTKGALPLVKRRLMECVSRGGSFALRWMKNKNKENFLYTYFDEILKIAKKYDVTLSLGDGLRPGCIADSTDKAQIHELKVLGELAGKARSQGVQVIIEGPGHIPLNEIEKNVKLEKKICRNAPFYVLGPLPTDIAAGYDHIACAVGGSLAAFHGADFLCYVTPKEHIGLPDIDDVREGVIVTKLAAHIADLARGNKKALERDRKMAKARKDFNWDRMMKLSLDPKRFKELRRSECLKNPQLKRAKYCTMCGEFCALRINI